MLDNIGVYSTFGKNAFLEMVAYRLRYYTGIFTYLIFVTVHYFIWQAVFAGSESGRVKGFTLSEMITYIAVGWIARSFYFSDIDEKIDDTVRSGNVSIMLLRPVSFQLMMYARAVGESLFRFIFFSLPISLVIVLIYPVALPASLRDTCLFAASTALGFLVFAGVNFVVGLLAFPLQSIEGILRAKYSVIQLCSGLLLPLSFFPQWLQLTLQALPFKDIAYTPLLFYLGRVPDAQVVNLLAQQLAWAIALFLIGAYCWRRAVATLTIQGG